MKNKLIIIFGSIIIMALIAGTYIWYQKFSNKLNEIQTQNDEKEKSNVLADWKTFQGDSYRIKYPPNFYFNGPSSITSYGPDILGHGGNPPKTEIKIYIYVYPGALNLVGEPLGTLDEWLTKVPIVLEKQEILIDGERAIRSKDQDPTFGSITGNVRIIKDNIGYQIGYAPYESDYADVFNQMLDTLEFIK